MQWGDKKKCIKKAMSLMTHIFLRFIHFHFNGQTINFNEIHRLGHYAITKVLNKQYNRFTRTITISLEIY